MLKFIFRVKTVSLVVEKEMAAAKNAQELSYLPDPVR
jgi:hypothetical protein